MTKTTSKTELSKSSKMNSEEECRDFLERAFIEMGESKNFEETLGDWAKRLKTFIDRQKAKTRTEMSVRIREFVTEIEHNF